MSDTQQSLGLRAFLTPREAWAFGLGTSIGWGSLVVTSNTYLAKAGPLGSVLGLIAGACVMLIVSRNYHYLILCHPDAGGAFAYARDTFGADRGFLLAWFLALTYMAMFWANATSLPLFAHYFLGGLFRVGRMYSLAGYDVYLGEALLSVAAILLAALICTRAPRAASKLMVLMAVLLTAAITLAFVLCFVHRERPIEPLFQQNGKIALRQIVRIAVISPWAFIGFESISHGAEEFNFRRSRSFRILCAAVLTATVLYCFVILLSVTAFPARYDSWIAYIADLGNLEGLDALPPFYAANYYLGSAGVLLLMAALLCLILTSLIGNLFALSRLLYAAARDELLPPRFVQLNGEGVPAAAVWLVALLSCLVPFAGRTAIGWIVDVTTLCATLIYGFVSAAAIKEARFRRDRLEQCTGAVGLFVMACYAIYLLVPALFGVRDLDSESYFIFITWSVLGVLYFRRIIKRDTHNRYGNALIVWIVFLSLILFVSLVWMNQAGTRATTEGLHNIQLFYERSGSGVDGSEFINKQLQQILRADDLSVLLVLGMFGLSLTVMLRNYSTMMHRANASEAALGEARNRVNTDPLTGVKSKHAYLEMEESLNRRIQSGAVSSFAVVLCDVNGLKHINDTQGHKAGDRHICQACRIICEHFKHSPVFRIGGDEFVALLEGSDYEERAAILGRFDSEIEANIAAGGVVVSAGSAEFAAGQDESYREVFERADRQMYQRKKQLKALGAITRD